MRKVEVWVDSVKTESLRSFSNYAFLDADVNVGAGSHTVDVFATGWDGLQQHSSFTLTVSPAPPPPPVGSPDFTIAATPTSATVRAGQAGSYAVTVGSQNGFTGSVTFACGGLPTGAACTFNPYPLAVTAVEGTTALQIKTTGAVASLLPPHPLSPARSQGALALLASGSFGVFGLFFIIAGMRNSRKRNKALLAMLAVPLAAVVLIAGCGGGGSAMTTTPPSTGGTSGTPTPLPTNLTSAGTYTVTITAASGSLQHATTVQLVVQ